MKWHRVFAVPLLTPGLILDVAIERDEGKALSGVIVRTLYAAQGRAAKFDAGFLGCC